RARRARRKGCDPLLPGRRPGDLRRGDRADVARQPRRGAGVGRAAARHLRPAGLLPLARSAAVGCDRARAARRDRRPTGGRLDGVAGPAGGLREARGALRARRGVGYRVGAHRAVAVAARVAVARRRRRGEAARPRHGCAGASARGLAAFASRSRGGARARRARAPREHRPRRRAGAVPARQAAEPERRPLVAARPLRPRCDLRSSRSRRGRLGAAPRYARVPMGADLVREHEAIRDQAERLAGGPGDIPQRVALLHSIFVDSGGNHAFPEVALHGALWAYGFYERRGAVSRSIAYRYFYDADERARRSYMLFRFSQGFKEANRSVFVDTYSNYVFSKRHGEAPGA